METKQCTRCQQTLPLSEFTLRKDREERPMSHCRRCRSEESGKQRDWPVACASCHRYKRLDPNGQCPKCNASAGLRWCRGPCGLVLPLLLGFYPGKARCKDCLKLARTARARSRSTGPGEPPPTAA